MADLSRARKFPERCDAATTRNGEEVPCDKPAVAVRAPSEWEYAEYGNEVGPWPVCVHHCRVGKMVPLSELLGDARE